MDGGKREGDNGHTTGKLKAKQSGLLLQAGMGRTGTIARLYKVLPSDQNH